MDVQAPFNHYRICNAAYAVLTSDAAVFRSACEAADRLAMSGFHLGVIWVNQQYPPLRLLSVANLIHPLQACVVVERSNPSWLRSLTESALELARADGTSPWRGRAPRLVTLDPAGTGAFAAGELVNLARGLASHSMPETPAPAPAIAASKKRREPQPIRTRAAAAVA